MNSKIATAIISVGLGVITFALVVGTAEIIIGIKSSKAMKAISKKTGIPYEEVKASFKRLHEKLAVMRKANFTDDQLRDEVSEFYKQFDGHAA
jgi:hypothetical protein